MNTEQATALRKPFPPESVGKLPKGGVMLDFVGHAGVTDRLLSVDPEWTWRPFTAEEILSLPPSLRDAGLWIHLTICGVTRPGVGDGKSAKECIGDAIRNAAMRFGVALDLWAKENLVEFEQAAGAAWATSAPPLEEPGEGVEDHVDQETGELLIDKPMTTRTRNQMFALFGELGIPDDDQLPGINATLGTDYPSRGRLTEAEAKQVIAVLKRKKEAAA